MEKLISCCGLDCATCDARVATVNNDNELRSKTAESWSAMYNAQITSEMINCMGCRESGILFGHCHECEIRNCVKAKGFQTCGECNEMNNCQKVQQIHQFVPDAVNNLLSLR